TIQRRRDPQATPILNRLHVLLWRLDNIVERVLVRTKELAPRVAELVIRAHAQAAYLKTFFNRVKRVLIRS
ncbi:MAG TPA: hypothetical protein VF177_17285, partial [Anaerolineae bacterium]